MHWTFPADCVNCEVESGSGRRARISEVRKKCGPPTEASQRQERKGWGYVLETVEIEEWTYNLGSTSFMVYLTFENGRLTRIESGEYGY